MVTTVFSDDVTGFAGAEVTLSHGQLDRQSEMQKTALSGSARFDLSAAYSLQVDAGAFDFNAMETEGHNLALHAIWHASDHLSLGAFFGTERVAHQSAGYYGLEAAARSGAFRGELYAARFVGDATREAKAFGLTATAEISPRFALGAEFDRFEMTGPHDVSKAALSATYQLRPNLSLTARVGEVTRGSGFGNIHDGFASLGVTLHLGAGRPHFRQRGLGAILPGG